jgi:hypothetical protein
MVRKKGVFVMDAHRWISVGLGLLALVVIGGFVSFFSPPSITAGVSTYQQVPLFGGVQNVPDPHTQYLVIDEGACSLYRNRPTTFLTFVDEHCRVLNPGRQRREADCRYRAELEAETRCRPAPVFSNVQPPEFLTGAVAVDPLSCAGLGENYDFIVGRSVASAKVQTIAMVNPCTGKAEVAARQEFVGDVPLRTYRRSIFESGDVLGDVVEPSGLQSDVHYVRCIGGSARVVVRGVPVCNTLD